MVEKFPFKPVIQTANLQMVVELPSAVVALFLSLVVMVEVSNLLVEIRPVVRQMSLVEMLIS